MQPAPPRASQGREFLRWTRQDHPGSSRFTPSWRPYIPSIIKSSVQFSPPSLQPVPASFRSPRSKLAGSLRGRPPSTMLSLMCGAKHHAGLSQVAPEASCRFPCRRRPSSVFLGVSADQELPVARLCCALRFLHFSSSSCGEADTSLEGTDHDAPLPRPAPPYGVQRTNRNLNPHKVSAEPIYSPPITDLLGIIIILCAPCGRGCPPASTC